MTYYLTHRPAPSRHPRIRGNELIIDAVNTILWLYWDPIGCGVPVDEYRNVAEDLVDYGPDSEFLWAEHLRDYQRYRIGPIDTVVDESKIATVVARVIEAMRTTV